MATSRISNRMIASMWAAGAALVLPACGLASIHAASPPDTGLGGVEAAANDSYAVQGWGNGRKRATPAPTPSPTPRPSTAPTASPTATPAPTLAPTATPAPVAGAALYVSTRGSDSNQGSSSAPLRTINAAVAKATAGTTILIEGGTYYERVRTKAAGTATSPIVFRSYNGTAVIDGTQTTWSSKSPNYGQLELYHNYIRVDGVNVANAGCSGIILTGSNIVVENSTISRSQNHGISNALWLKPDAGYSVIKNITIRNNVFRDNTLSRSGQGISLAADGFLIAGNDVSGTYDIGIDVWTGGKHGEIVDNVVHDNPGDGPSNIGIYTDGVSYVRIHRNRVYNNGAGIVVSSEEQYYDNHHIWVYNNLVYNNREIGLGIWDDTASFPGSQNVLFANNTIINNKTSIYLSFSHNSAEIMNNVAYPGGIYDSSTNSTYKIHDNVWLSSITGFVSPSIGDFRLTSTSPALEKGRAIPTFSDDQGNTFSVTTDFAKLSRVAGTYPDAGAYEYR